VRPLVRPSAFRTTCAGLWRQPDAHPRRSRLTPNRYPATRPRRRLLVARRLRRLESMSNGARAIIIPIIRKTAGWNRESERLSLPWLAKAGSIERARVPAALRELQSLGIIAVDSPPNKGQASTIRLTLETAQTRTRPRLSMQTRLDGLVPVEHHLSDQSGAQTAPGVVPTEHQGGAQRAPNKRSSLSEPLSEREGRRLNGRSRSESSVAVPRSSISHVAVRTHPSAGSEWSHSQKAERRPNCLAGGEYRLRQERSRSR